jgi:hypothetical protein
MATDIKDPYIKGLFASMETSGNISGDYLQLEKNTLRDLKQRKLVPNEITLDKMKRYPEIYDTVAQTYLNDIMKTFKIPTVEEAALWSYRPGWYSKYGGDINAIPDTAKGSFGKTGKEVMQLRSQLLQKYIKDSTNAQ